MNQKFQLLIIALLVLSTTKSISQEIYHLTPEIVSKSNIPPTHNSIFSVEFKDIEYYPLVDTLVYSKHYESMAKDIKSYQKDYDLYMEEVRADSTEKAQELQIKKYISDYLASPNKKDKSMLDNAQTLSDMRDFHFYYKSTNVHKEDKPIYIKKGKRYASEKMLDDYLYVLEKRITGHRKVFADNRVKSYLEAKSAIKEMSNDEKYQKVQAPSSHPKKRKAYIIGDGAELSPLNSTFEFEVISDKSYLTYKPEGSNYVENELTEEHGSHIRSSKGYGLFSILHDRNTKQYYAMINDDGWNRILATIQNNKSQDYLTSLGLKVIDIPRKGYEPQTYKGIETKHSYIEFSNSLVKKIESDKSYLTKVDGFWSQYETLQNQLMSYESGLEKYYNIWRIKGRDISNSDISAWKVLTQKAIPILEKIVDLTDENYGIYSNTKSKKELVGKSSYATDLLINSRSVLGL